MLHILHFSGRRQVLLVKERHPIARRYLSIVCLLNCQATSGSAEPKSTFLFGATKAGGGRGRRAGGGRKSRREKPKAPKRGSQRRQRQLWGSPRGGLAASSEGTYDTLARGKLVDDDLPEIDRSR